MLENTPVNFGENSARRIVQAVRRVESMLPMDASGLRRQPLAEMGLWAELTSDWKNETNEKGYRWKAMHPNQASAYAMAADSDGFTGRRAICPNMDKSLTTGDRVYLELAGDDAGEPWYLITERPWPRRMVKICNNRGETYAGGEFYKGWIMAAAADSPVAATGSNATIDAVCGAAGAEICVINAGRLGKTGWLIPNNTIMPAQITGAMAKRTIEGLDYYYPVYAVFERLPYPASDGLVLQRAGGEWRAQLAEMAEPA